MHHVPRHVHTEVAPIIHVSKHINATRTRVGYLHRDLRKKYTTHCCLEPSYGRRGLRGVWSVPVPHVNIVCGLVVDAW